MSLFTLLLIIIVEGFVSISIEILTIRQLLPFAGSSVIVSSVIIGFFLLFLAYGYLKGGSYNKQYCKILRKNFLLSTAILGVGLSYCFISTFFNFANYNFNLNYLFVLTLYLSLIIAPLVYLLGQTVPITMNLFKSHHKVSKIGSKVLHYSTIGSFLGSVLTSLLLLNFLGVAWSIFINCLLLTFICFIITPQKNIYEKFFIPSLCILTMVFLINVNYEKKEFLLTNVYGNYQKIEQATLPDKRTGKVLLVNKSMSSFIDNDNKGFNYIEKIKNILFDDLKIRGKHILVLGAGGFTLSTETTNQNKFTYVDIDKDIYKITNKEIIKSINGDFIAQDARIFLNKTNEKYDVIIADAYNSKDNIPSHLVTREYFLRLKSRVSDKGYAIFNVISNPTLQDKYSKRFDNTLRTVFSNCIAIPTKYVDEPVNLLYVCSNNQKQDYTVYIDNKNQSVLDKSMG